MSLVFTYESNPNGCVISHLHFLVATDGRITAQVSHDGVYWIDLDLSEIDLEWNDLTISRNDSPE